MARAKPTNRCRFSTAGVQISENFRPRTAAIKLVIPLQAYMTAAMKNYLKLAAVAFVSACTLLALSIGSLSAAESNYSFKVHNTTKDTITKLLASEDGKTFANFDIGKGIKGGQTVTLVWDKSTDEGECEHYFKAVFADGEETEAIKFDFCEDDLTLEF